MIYILAKAPTPQQVHYATDTWSGGAVVLLLVIVVVAWLKFRTPRGRRGR
jgi:hypothetical protein